MRPFSTPVPDLSTTAQVTIRVPHAELPNRFTISAINLVHSDVTWSNNSKTYAPVEDPTVDYLSFTAVVGDPQAFKCQAGVCLLYTSRCV